MFVRFFAAGGVWLGALVVLLGFAAGPASAGRASVSYPIFAADVSGGAVTSPVLTFPDGTTSTILLNFVLPADYKDGTTVKVFLYLSNGSNACNARILPQQLGRRRIGIPAVNNLAGVNGGGAQVAFPSDGSIVGKVFKIKPADTFPGQQSGDGLLLGIKREGGKVIDTCSVSVFVQQIDIRYTTK